MAVIEIIFAVVFLIVFLGFIMNFSNKSRVRSYRKQNQYRITEDKIADQWTALLDKGADEADKVMEKIARAVRDANISGATVSKKVVAFDRDQLPFVVVEHEKLPDYCMYVGALPSGNRLNVLWYLTFDSADVKIAERQERMAQRMTGAVRALGGDLGKAVVPEAGAPSHFVPNISMRDKVELSNFVSLVHNIVMDETKKMMDDLQLDTSRLSTGTDRGFVKLS